MDDMNFIAVVQQYRDRLKQHIKYVQEACSKLGVPVCQSTIHDESKWSTDELEPYARQFCGDHDRPDEFAVALLHHIHRNPHHWQHWIFPDNYIPKGSTVENGVVRMPENYCLEMIADCMPPCIEHLAANAFL